MSEVKRYKVKATELHGLDVELSGHVAVVVMEGDYHAESARADTAVRELAKVKAELNETWIDEHQTVWTRPTAWAYMQVCKAHDKHQARADRAEARVKELEQYCRDQDRNREDAIIEALEKQECAEAAYKELAQLVEGLPKYKGEVVAIQDTDVFWQVCWRGDDGEFELVCDHMNKREADALAALLAWRQKEAHDGL